MKILKKFDSYIKEDLEMMANPATKPTPSTTPAPATPTIQPGTKPERRDRPTPIRRDRPAVEPDPQAKIKMDRTEEEGTYIGTQMLQDLADALGTEVMDNAVQYDGKTINFYSETENFHVDKKRFETVEEVVDYLTGGDSAIEKEMRETEEEKAKQMIEDDSISYEDEFEEEVEDLEDDLEDEEEIVRGRHIKEFENFMYDDEDDSTDDFNQYEDDFGREDEFGDEYEEEFSGEDYDDNEFYQSEEKCCPTCTCEPCECVQEEEFSEEDEERDDFKMSESHVTKKFNNFR